MGRSRRQRALCWTALLAAFWAAAASGAEPVDPPAPFPKDGNVYVVENELTWTVLTLLEASGRFRVVNRDHMALSLRDEGRWEQRPGGEVWLCSEHRGRTLALGPSSHAISKDDGVDLKLLRDGFASLLKKQRGALLAKKDVVAAAPARLATALQGMPAQVQRGYVEDLSKDIEHYLSTGAPNLKRFVPWAHQGKTYLVDAEVLEERRREIREEVARGKGLYFSITTPVLTDAATFQKLLGTTQEFLFHPEMNQGAEQRAARLLHMMGPRIEPSCGTFAQEPAAK